MVARNTGRGSRSAALGAPSPGWRDLGYLRWVVWEEDGEVVIYEGERETSQRRHVFTAGEAEELIGLLATAVGDARRGRDA